MDVMNDYALWDVIVGKRLITNQVISDIGLKNVFISCFYEGLERYL